MDLHFRTRIFWALSSCMLLATSATASNPLISRQSATCSRLHLMIAGGCGIPCAADVPSYFATLIGNITAAFPESDQYFVPYNGSQNQAQVSTPLMIEAANEYFDTCPNTPVVFIGYSLGGVVVMNTLCGGISSINTPNVIAAILYGEETQTYPQTYDYGTCTNSAPRYPRANTAACNPYAPIIHSYCDLNDPQCCGGTDNQVHFEYPAKYDLSAVAFVKAQYTSYHPTSSSSLVSSTSIAPSSTPPISSSPPPTSVFTGISSTITPQSISTSTTQSIIPSTSSSSSASSIPQPTLRPSSVSSLGVKLPSTSYNSTTIGIDSVATVTHSSSFKQSLLSPKSSTMISESTSTVSSMTLIRSTSISSTIPTGTSSATSTTVGNNNVATTTNAHTSVTPYTGSASSRLGESVNRYLWTCLSLGLVAVLLHV